MKDADATTVRHALDALAALGEPAVPNLVDILEKHKELRVEAAYTLGQMGPAAAAATDALAKLVADEDLHLATEAILALGKIGPAAKDAVPALCAALRAGRRDQFSRDHFRSGEHRPRGSSGQNRSCSRPWRAKTSLWQSSLLGRSSKFSLRPHDPRQPPKRFRSW